MISPVREEGGVQPPFFHILVLPHIHMTDLFSHMSRHGYALVFAFVLAEATGFPVPAALALVAGGAAAGSGTVSLPGIFLTAVVALLIGDTFLFILGRYTGWGLLGVLCRLSVNPESCILRSAESFYKRGKMTLLSRSLFLGSTPWLRRWPAV